MKLDILTAVYNGERFIRQQLDSVLAQTYTDWHMLICDDGSTDGTRGILTEYKNRYPDKIDIYFNEKNLGVKNNFFGLLAMSDADNIMFCDQDDVWDSRKIEKTLDVMQKNADGRPLLVHTDMTVTDENGNVISNSFHKMQAIDASKNSLNRLLVQNTVTGCTAMINRRLADIIKTPECATLHDWWVAVVAAAFGRIIFLDEPTMQYRRHTANLRGARSMKSPAYVLGRARDKKDAAAMLRLGYEQSAELARIYRDRLTPEQYELLYEYGSCLEKTKPEKLKTVLKYKILKQGAVRMLGQFIYM